jgi:hypothetical protein
LSRGRNATSSTLRYRVEAPFAPAPLASDTNSDFGPVKYDEPQSKQTKSFENALTPGLSRFFKPEKWMIISAVNSVSLPDPQNRQDIKASHRNLRLKEAGNSGLKAESNPLLISSLGG